MELFSDCHNLTPLCRVSWVVVRKLTSFLSGFQLYIASVREYHSF